MAEHRRYLTDFRYQIALGLFPDMEVIHKYGDNPSISTTQETVWNVGGDLVWLDAATGMEMTCTDNVNGQGQLIEVYGLDENWTEKTASFALTGQTPVPIGNWTSIFRARQVSAAPDPVGNVYIATDAATYSGGVPQEANLIHALVRFTGDINSTESCFLQVPAGHIGILTYFSACMAQATGSARTADVSIDAAKLAQGATVSNPSWTPLSQIDRLQVGTNQPCYTTTYEYPLYFTELTRIEVRAAATAESEIRADFTIIFVPAS